MLHFHWVFTHPLNFVHGSKFKNPCFYRICPQVDMLVEMWPTDQYSFDHTGIVYCMDNYNLCVY